ncbi:MAG: hypothetical protein M3P44_15990 [Actinomycetota bacterium]|nr:hypothetical protein [Actinomycetota bacterium]
MIGQAKELDELQAWLERCADGIAARADTPLTKLFPAFRIARHTTFRVELVFSSGCRRELSRAQPRGPDGVGADAMAVTGAADLIAAEVGVCSTAPRLSSSWWRAQPACPKAASAGRTRSD